MSESEGSSTAIRNRSPRYPSTPLDACIERVRVLYQHEKRNAGPPETIVSHWGYTNPRGGVPTSLLAALKQFGLLEEVGPRGDRRLRLTQLAVDILLNPDPVAVSMYIRQAATMPPLHSELLAHYSDGLPSDATLIYELVRNRGFTESGATDFIRQFRSTLAFAGIGDGDSVEANDDLGTGEAGEPEMDRFDPPPADESPESGGGEDGGKVTTIPVPLIGGTQFVQVSGQFPMSEADWDQFMAVLGVMKPGLTRRAESDANEPQPDA